MPTCYDGSTSIVDLSRFLKFGALSYLGEKRVYVSGLILGLLELLHVIVRVRRQFVHRGRRRHWRRHFELAPRSALLFSGAFYGVRRRIAVGRSVLESRVRTEDACSWHRAVDRPDDRFSVVHREWRNFVNTPHWYTGDGSECRGSR